MSKKMEHRDSGSKERIVAASLALLRRGGLLASGVNNVASEGNAPKGSIYHFFPGGKTAIVLAALQCNRNATAAAILKHLGSERTLPRRVGAMYAEVIDKMTRDGFAASCAVGAVALDVGTEDVALRVACAQTLTYWIDLVAENLHELPPKKRRPAAELFISLLEGAELAARALNSPAPLLNAEQSFLIYLKGLAD